MPTSTSMPKMSETVTKGLRVPDFVDRLLLGIITIHPSNKKLSPPKKMKEQSRRLAAARRALLNEKTNSREITDFEALEFMARELQKVHDRRWWQDFRRRYAVAFRSEPEISRRQLAKRAVHLADQISSRQSTEDRLRAKLAKHERQLLYLARQSYRSDLRRLTEDKVLNQVAVLLEPYLAMHVRPTPKRKATLISAKFGENR
jgi:hypothetical protein